MRALVIVAIACVSLAAQCDSDPCHERIADDTTADFSAVRLDGKLACDNGDVCEMVFAGTTGTLTIRHDNSENVLVYDVQYNGTHTQVQNVTHKVNLGGKGPCVTSEQYVRETWTVPTVSMLLRSGTRNGQPLPLDQTTWVGRKPSAFFPRLEVQTHYVDRSDGRDEYVGVLVTGQPVTVADSPEMAITRNGGRFAIGPNNPR